jgi:hypothetical protein
MVMGLWMASYYAGQQELSVVMALSMSRLSMEQGNSDFTSSRTRICVDDGAASGDWRWDTATARWRWRWRGSAPTCRRARSPA